MTCVEFRVLQAKSRGNPDSCLGEIVFPEEAFCEFVCFWVVKFKKSASLMIGLKLPHLEERLGKRGRDDETVFPSPQTLDCCADLDWKITLLLVFGKSKPFTTDLI